MKDLSEIDKALSLPTSRINTLLGRNVSVDLSGTQSMGSLSQYSSIVRLPKFIEDILRQVFDTSGEVMEEDLLVGRLLSDGLWADQFYSLWDAIKERLMTENDSLPTMYKTHASDAKELSTAQVLYGAPIWHTPLGDDTHFKFASIPDGFLKRDWSWVPSLAGEMQKRYGIKRADTLSMPRMTSQGVLLKSKREPADWRVFSKSLLGCIGALSPDSASYCAFLDQMNSLFEDRGFYGPAFDFIQGIRRQHTRKSEPICSPYTTSVDESSVIGSSEAVQGRVRGIMMPVEASKARMKFAADGLKKALFGHSNIFNVDMSHIRSKMIRIYRKFEDMESQGVSPVDSEGGYLGFVDLSAYDTSTHRGFFDLYYQCLEEMFPDFLQWEGVELMNRSGILCPRTCGVRSPIMRTEVAGRSTLSGESMVTVKNNVVHLLMNIQALSEVFGISPKDAWDNLESSSHEWELQLHGDDCMRYFGSDPSVYDKVDSIMTEFGVGISRELSASYLKKHLDYGTDNLVGITGSLMKNRFSEYGVKHDCVLLMGLYDTFSMIPSAYKEVCRPLWDHLLTLTDRGLSMTTLNESYIRSVVQPELIEMAKQSVGNARAVQGYLDRLFYSNGELLNDQLLELYGSLSYDPLEEGENYNLPLDDVAKLEAIALKCQAFMLDNNGSIPPYKTFISEVNVDS